MGLGRILLQALTEAAQQNGIERFRAEVSASNEQVIRSLTRLGAEGGDVEDLALSLELHLPIEAFSNSAMYEALRTVAAAQAALDTDRDTPARVVPEKQREHNR
jgi:RimJ/RimL family protein N-acetyltransferase